MAGSGNPTLSGSTRVVASRDQLSTQLSGEAVILGLRDNVYYGLDGAGARFWELVQQPSTLSDVAGAISRDFEVGEGAALRDLLALAGELLSRGLLQVVPRTDS
jgi:hypothetical protein